MLKQTENPFAKTDKGVSLVFFYCANQNLNGVDLA